MRKSTFVILVVTLFALCGNAWAQDAGKAKSATAKVAPAIKVQINGDDMVVSDLVGPAPTPAPAAKGDPKQPVFAPKVRGVDVVGGGSQFVHADATTIWETFKPLALKKEEVAQVVKTRPAAGMFLNACIRKVGAKYPAAQVIVLRYDFNLNEIKSILKEYLAGDSVDSGDNGYIVLFRATPTSPQIIWGTVNMWTSDGDKPFDVPASGVCK